MVSSVCTSESSKMGRCYPKWASVLEIVWLALCKCVCIDMTHCIKALIATR